MAWTADDLFLVCIMKSGSVCIVSRLGEPLILNIHGQGLNLGPSYYLPLHPLQIIRYNVLVDRWKELPL